MTTEHDGGEHEGAARYRMLETIRQYGRRRLAESGPAEERRLLRRHRDHFRALAEHLAANWYRPGQEQALARLRTEHGNLRVALEFGGGPAEADDAQATTPAPGRASPVSKHTPS